jgi:glycosyltransferase involved in cell wall biosynthesis
VSDGGSLPEVVGDAGEIVRFSSHDVRDRLEEKEFDQNLADSMGRVLRDGGLRERMRHRGIDRVKEFSWERVARQTLDVYEKVRNVNV